MKCLFEENGGILWNILIFKVMEFLVWVKVIIDVLNNKLMIE